jgi:hypothetical protein
LFLFFCVWGKRLTLFFMCRAIARTKTHATCELDHLWNDELWIKLTSICPHW